MVDIRAGKANDSSDGEKWLWCQCCEPRLSVGTFHCQYEPRLSDTEEKHPVKMGARKIGMYAKGKCGLVHMYVLDRLEFKR